MSLSDDAAPGPLQFSLRSLFRWVAVICVVAAGWAAFARWQTWLHSHPDLPPAKWPRALTTFLADARTEGIEVEVRRVRTSGYTMDGYNWTMNYSPELAEFMRGHWNLRPGAPAELRYFWKRMEDHPVIKLSGTATYLLNAPRHKGDNYFVMIDAATNAIYVCYDDNW